MAGQHHSFSHIMATSPCRHSRLLCSLSSVIKWWGPFMLSVESPSSCGAFGSCIVYLLGNPALVTTQTRHNTLNVLCFTLRFLLIFLLKMFEGELHIGSVDKYFELSFVMNLYWLHLEMGMADVTRNLFSWVWCNQIQFGITCIKYCG